MKDVLLLLFGGFIGFDLAIGYSWWTLRRANRHAGIVARVNPYVGRRRQPQPKQDIESDTSLRRIGW